MLVGVRLSPKIAEYELIKSEAVKIKANSRLSFLKQSLFMVSHNVTLPESAAPTNYRPDRLIVVYRGGLRLAEIGNFVYKASLERVHAMSHAYIYIDSECVTAGNSVM